MDGNSVGSFRETGTRLRNLGHILATCSNDQVFRLIARLDVKGEKLVKPIHLEGLRVVGDPHEYALRYYHQGADELLYMDAVASLYGRNHLAGLIERATDSIFVPVTVGGGVRSLDDVRALFSAGADKICLNTAAVRTPDLVARIADRYGAQAVTVSIEAKRSGSGWEAFTDNGRERTGKDAVQWAHDVVELGAGEILATSIDQEGTQKGFDLDLIRALAGLPVPVVASGGCGSVEHVQEARDAGADAVAVAHCLHYGKFTVREARG